MSIQRLHASKDAFSALTPMNRRYCGVRISNRTSSGKSLGGILNLGLVEKVSICVPCMGSSECVVMRRTN